MNRALLLSRSLATGPSPAPELVPGALAIYLCNDGSLTTLTDSSGHGLHGTFGVDPATPAPIPGGGIRFAGDDHALIGALIDAMAGATAMTMFLVVAATTKVVHGGIMGPSSTPASRQFMTLIDSSNGSSDADSISCDVTGPTADVYQSLLLPGRLTPAPTLLTLRFRGGAGGVFEARRGLSGPWVQSANQAMPALRTTISSTSTFRLGMRSTTGLRGDVHALVVYLSYLDNGQVAQNDGALEALMDDRGIALA